MPCDDPVELFGTTMALTSVDFCMPRSVISFQTISSRLGNALSFGPSFRNSVWRDRRSITVMRHTLDGTFGQMRPSRTCCLGKGMSERMPSARLLLRSVRCVFNMYVNCSNVQLPTVVLSMIDSDFSQALHSRAMLGMHLICCMIIHISLHIYLSSLDLSTECLCLSWSGWHPMTMRRSARHHGDSNMVQSRFRN